MGKCESPFVGATWPDELGPRPAVPRMCWNSGRQDEEERQFAAEVLAQIRCLLKRQHCQVHCSWSPKFWLVAFSSGHMTCKMPVRGSQAGSLLLRACIRPMARAALWISTMRIISGCAQYATKTSASSRGSLIFMSAWAVQMHLPIQIPRKLW